MSIGSNYIVMNVHEHNRDWGELCNRSQTKGIIDAVNKDHPNSTHWIGSTPSLQQQHGEFICVHELVSNIAPSDIVYLGAKLRLAGNKVQHHIRKSGRIVLDIIPDVLSPIEDLEFSAKSLPYGHELQTGLIEKMAEAGHTFTPKPPAAACCGEHDLDTLESKPQSLQGRRAYPMPDNSVIEYNPYTDSYQKVQPKPTNQPPSVNGSCADATSDASSKTCVRSKHTSNISRRCYGTGPG